MLGICRDVLAIEAMDGAYIVFKLSRPVSWKAAEMLQYSESKRNFPIEIMFHMYYSLYRNHEGEIRSGNEFEKEPSLRHSRPNLDSARCVRG